MSESGVRVLNHRLIDKLGITAEQVDEIAAAESAELTRRVRRYRADRPAVPVRGRTVIVIDDGLATGFTARAAIEVLRALGTQRIVLAVPVGPADTVEELSALADDVVCLHTPRFFMAIGPLYADFHQVREDEVADLLARYADAPHRDDRDRGPPARALTRDVRISAGSALLAGTLTVPPDPIGVVIFAHGSGSSRLSPRNIAVARALESGGLATLRFDLLDSTEEADRANVFDVDLLAGRLADATRWVQDEPETQQLRIGYFGASTGAAAALHAAARFGSAIAAVVSRGGRPDLAGSDLRAVTAPVLLIVGGRDTPVIALNERARRQLRCVHRLEIVPGATHLFTEPGALELVSGLARDWFTTHLPTPAGRPDTSEQHDRAEGSPFDARRRTDNRAGSHQASLSASQ